MASSSMQLLGGLPMGPSVSTPFVELTEPTIRFTSIKKLFDELHNVSGDVLVVTGMYIS